MEVIEHVDNPISFLETCAELPGGHLFLSTINTPLSYFLTILLAERVLRMVTPRTHTHSKYIKPTELIDFFKQYRSPLDPESPAVDCPHLPYPTRTEAENAIICSALGSRNPHTRGHPCFISVLL